MEPPRRTEQVLETVGSIAIGLAAALCSGIMQLSSSPFAIATLVTCGCVLLPFVCLALLTLTVGLMCCVPLVLIGAACACIPALVHHARIAAHLAGTGCRRVADYAKENPAAVAGFCLASLPLLPVITIGAALGALGFLFFAPITIPATLFLLWRWMPMDLKSTELAAAAAAAFAAPAAQGHSGPSQRVKREHASPSAAEAMASAPAPGYGSAAAAHHPPMETGHSPLKPIFTLPPNLCESPSPPPGGLTERHNPSPPIVPLAVPLAPLGAPPNMPVDPAFLAAATRALAACKAAEIRGTLGRESSAASSA